MLLKQRFAEGRTNVIDIGDDFMLIQQNAEDFEMRLQEHFKENELQKDCIAFVCYGKKEEPIYKDFPQWIYTNDGQLFMTLV